MVKYTAYVKLMCAMFLPNELGGWEKSCHKLFPMAQEGCKDLCSQF